VGKLCVGDLLFVIFTSISDVDDDARCIGDGQLITAAAEAAKR